MSDQLGKTMAALKLTQYYSTIASHSLPTPLGSRQQDKTKASPTRRRPAHEAQTPRVRLV